MTRDISLIEYLPPVLQTVRELQVIIDAQDIEFQTAVDAADQLLDNLFIEHCDLDGIKRWENVVGIIANPETESLDFRRKRIINIYGTQLPYTVRRLGQKLDTIIGQNLWEIIVDNASYRLYIQSAEPNQMFMTELQKTIEKVKPANMEFVYIVWILRNIQIRTQISNYPFEVYESGVELCGTQHSEATTGVIVLRPIQVSRIITAYAIIFPDCGANFAGAISA